ncbi:diaminopimelate decarboxylase [Francisella philomiragia]|uniref:diaminopimelate decarboxylase n=1 Tax=Francisella philomiragia TaxID=28110 RepID=UPI00190612CE|nr:diaminopimelate decarboxylase [Francisella philomiragia]MBK2105985.1 diaminopimelate decarboxylase [Francisella philomiragia]
MSNYIVFDRARLANYIKEHKLTTPCYIYDSTLLEDTFASAKKALDKNFKNAEIHYAIKANHHLKIVNIAKKYGMGIDCVSGGEIRRALEQNVDPQHIVFAGVGKADWEIELAIDNDIFAFNSESLEEIEVISQIASSKNKQVNICLRVNPNIDAQTHHYISTGQFDDKFGIAFIDVLKWLKNDFQNFDNINIIGLHYHVGSQILNYQVFQSLAITTNEHIKLLKQNDIDIEHINFGGGLGIDYQNPQQNPIVDFDNYFARFREFFEYCDDVKLHFELGRSLVGQSGVLVSQVLFNKVTQDTHFAIIDAGMTELIRPALYQAQHKIEALIDESVDEKQHYHIVGPICESSDVFAKYYQLPKIKRGDLLAIYSAGAYGKVLASEYNLRPTVQEYFI